MQIGASKIQAYLENRGESKGKQPYLHKFYIPLLMVGVFFIQSKAWDLSLTLKLMQGANIYEFTISEIPPSRDAYNGRIKIQYHFIRANRYAILQEKPKSRAFDIYTRWNHHSNRGCI